MTMFITKMSPEGWTCVPSNPRQRNTERHADKIESYLKVALPQHAVVSAAQLPSGKFIKLDGHTRCQLWEQERIPVPHQISVQVFPVRDAQHAAEMYEMYDNKMVTKHAADSIFGALREAGVFVRSPFMQRSCLSSALRNVCEPTRKGSAIKHKDWCAHTAVLEWHKEIAIVDGILVRSGIGGSNLRLHSGVVGAMLVSARKYPLNAIEGFWSDYLIKEVGLTTEPAMKLREVVAGKKGAGRDGTVYLAKKALSCLEHHKAGNRITKVYGVNLYLYLRRKFTAVAASQGQAASRQSTETHAAL